MLHFFPNHNFYHTCKVSSNHHVAALTTMFNFPNVIIPCIIQLLFCLANKSTRNIFPYIHMCLEASAGIILNFCGEALEDETGDEAVDHKMPENMMGYQCFLTGSD